MQKPDSECANNHITHVSEVQMGFLSWIGNILEREKPVDTATDWLLHGLRLAAVSVLLAAHTARVGLWNRLAPVCHLRWGRCENHKTTSGSSGIVQSSCSLPYSSMVIWNFILDNLDPNCTIGSFKKQSHLLFLNKQTDILKWNFYHST